MPRPKRSKIVTAPRTAPVSDAPAEPTTSHRLFRLVDDGIPGPNASLETLVDGRNPKWADRMSQETLDNRRAELNSIGERFTMAGALGQEDLAVHAKGPTQRLESPQLLRAKKKSRKLKDAARKTREAERRKSVRKSQDLVARVSPEELEHEEMVIYSSKTGKHGFKLGVAVDVKMTGENSPGATLLDDIPGAAREAMENVQSANDVPATPSMLSLVNFRQRPRQPSILAMVQQTDVGADTLSGGDTAALDDSILARLQQSPSSSHNDDTQNRSSTRPVHSSSSRKRKASAIEGRLPPSPTTGSGSGIEARRQSPGFVATPASTMHAEIAVPNETRNSRRKHYQSPAPITATSPQSSQVEAPIDPNPKTPKKIVNPRTAALQALLPKRVKTAQDAYRYSFDIYDSSELELHGTDGAEDEDDEDTDELSRPVRRRRAAQAASKKIGRSKKVSSLTRPNPKTRARQPLGKGSAKAANATATPSVAASGKAARTYGRRAAEDVENDAEQQGSGTDAEGLSDGDASIEVGRTAPARKGRLSGELAHAKEKFKMVDEWELDFESCDVGGGSSSPWR